MADCDVGRVEVDAVQARGADHEVGQGLAGEVVTGVVGGPSRRIDAGSSSIRAPIRRSRSMMARRVGFTPTSRSRSSASGWMAPATSQKAAADTSPGTRSSIACTVVPPCIDQVTAPSVTPRSTGTPRARSIRSVWSRVATDSRTVVLPSARTPANRIADFTWALGTGVV